MQLPRRFRRWSVWRGRISVWALVGLFLLNILMFVAGRKMELRITESEFEKASDQIETRIVRSFQQSGRQLGTLEDYWLIHGLPTGEQFGLMTRRILDQSVEDWTYALVSP